MWELLKTPNPAANRTECGNLNMSYLYYIQVQQRARFLVTKQVYRMPAAVYNCTLYTSGVRFRCDQDHLQDHGNSPGKPLRSLLRLRHCVTDALATGVAAGRHQCVPSLVPPANCRRPLARAAGIRRTSRRTRPGSRQPGSASFRSRTAR